MNTCSPLRYPGGKAVLADLIGKIRSLNDLGGLTLAEPYAGGAGASITLLYLEYTKEVAINDFDVAIHDLWWSLVFKNREFVDLLTEVSITMEEWYMQRAIYRSSSDISRLDRGLLHFFESLQSIRDNC